LLLNALFPVPIAHSAAGELDRSAKDGAPMTMCEWFLFVVKLGCVGLLATGCALAPLVAAVVVSPWIGVVVAFGSFWIWARVGPPPCPGFLSGILCTWGHGAILGSLVACAALAVRQM
jgi:hypothetical protein